MSYAIFQLARSHRARAASLLRDMGLHPGQELLLMQLFDRDGQTQSELVECVGLDHSTVSKALTRMQSAGLIIREPAPGDRRAVVVHLTKKGRALHDPIARMWQTLEELSTRNLSDQQADDFLVVVCAITEAIGAQKPEQVASQLTEG